LSLKFRFVKALELDLARALLYLTPPMKEGFERLGTSILVKLPIPDNYMVEENGEGLTRESTPRVG
jgi:hypothetical protein